MGSLLDILVGVTLGVCATIIYDAVDAKRIREGQRVTAFTQKGQNYLVVHRGEKADTLLQDSTGAYYYIHKR